MINLVLVTVLLLFRRIGAEQIDIIRIQIQEELPAETLLIPSISSARTVQWFSSSLLFQPYFQLKENHSLYTSDHRLDREEFCRRKLCNCSTCSIDLNFFQLFDDRNVTIGRIEILLEDINDHPPKFEQTIVHLSLAENLPIGYEILLQAASDEDQGRFSIQHYQLYPMLNNPFRLVNKTKPILKLKESIDREKVSRYSLTLIAFDGGEPVLSAEQIIEISVTDVNDHAPIFNQTVYHRSIGEDEPIGRILLQVSAYDRDEGLNSQLHYTIDDPSFTFTIDSDRGTIALKKSLDYEEQRSFSFPVIVSDGGHPSFQSYATVRIDVTDVNDHSPRLLFPSLNRTSIVELHSCTLSLLLYTFDDDSADNARIECQLNETRLIINEFTLNTYTIELDRSVMFDDEQEKSIFVQVTCFDHGTPRLETSRTLQIEISTCHLHRPILHSINQSVLVPSETIDLPWIITELLVKDDDDQDGTFRFTFTAQPSLNLSVDEDQRLLLHALPTIPGSFTVNITVYDRMNLSSSLSLALEVPTRLTDYTTIPLLIILFLFAILIAIAALIGCLLHSSFSSHRTLDEVPTLSNMSMKTTSSLSMGNFHQSEFI